MWCSLHEVPDQSSAEVTRSNFTLIRPWIFHFVVRYTPEWTTRARSTLLSTWQHGNPHGQYLPWGRYRSRGPLFPSISRGGLYVCGLSWSAYLAQDDLNDVKSSRTRPLIPSQFLPSHTFCSRRDIVTARIAWDTTDIGDRKYVHLLSFFIFPLVFNIGKILGASFCHILQVTRYIKHSWQK